jgi:hypothetical protein
MDLSLFIHQLLYYLPKDKICFGYILHGEFSFHLLLDPSQLIVLKIGIFKLQGPDQAVSPLPRPKPRNLHSGASVLFWMPLKISEIKMRPQLNRAVSSIGFRSTEIFINIETTRT